MIAEWYCTCFVSWLSCLPPVIVHSCDVIRCLCISGFMFDSHAEREPFYVIMLVCCEDLKDRIISHCDVITPVCCEHLKDRIISFSDLITSIYCERLKDRIISLSYVTMSVCCENLKDRIISVTESWFVQTLHNNVYQVWRVYAGFDSSYRPAVLGPKGV